MPWLEERKLLIREGTIVEATIIAAPSSAKNESKERGPRKAMAEGAIEELTQQPEKVKAQVRARVEHPFHILKNLFRHRKTRDRGLAKNAAQLHSLFALANLVIARRALLATVGA